MAARVPKKRLALDTNVLFDLANGQEMAHDFKEVFQSNGYTLVIAPTVVASCISWRTTGTQSGEFYRCAPSTS